MRYYRNAFSHVQQNSGIALPSTLIAIFLGLFVLRLAQIKTSTVVQIRSDLRLIHNLKQDLLQNISEESLSETRCNEAFGKYSNEQRKWLRCRELSSSYRTLPETELPTFQFDFDLVLRDAIKCPAQSISAPLRYQAIPYASRSCVFTTLSVNGLTVGENLEGRFLSLTKPTLPTLAVVATPGRFAVDQVLETQRDLLIVSGGDVSINKIANPGLQPIRVTIVSARGNISVNSVGARVHLLVVGRGTMKAPSTDLLRPYLLPPEVAAPRIIGIMPSEVDSMVPRPFER